ncbi:hypothetical protein M899_2571 [Bacteriovorax sp. BSW11_IV]|uniref:hypothetical protein n=1 Tax=Bacteriovorax sp. BSW11_IV TaxID=1353529 RepID=UPI000389DA9A|nr:hypothetical protein [Bacteriovorax sp. BSW11_IV]EQC50342.1 hypothetical protein M899_2571 [Bacteriovorax sp. BSW11_IV]
MRMKLTALIFFFTFVALFLINKSEELWSRDPHNEIHHFSHYQSNKNIDRTPASFDTSISQNLEEEIQKLKDCYSKICNFPNKDPRMHDLALGQKIKDKLFKLKEKALNEKSNPKYSEIAREYLKIEDGHVKEAALALMSTQPISSENFHSIVQDVLKYHDDALIEDAMMELERYQKLGHQEQITEALTESFQVASPMIKEKLAKGLFPFINEDTFNKYSEMAQNQNWNAKSVKILRSNLRRFERERM